jgi:hypothetical protein
VILGPLGATFLYFSNLLKSKGAFFASRRKNSFSSPVKDILRYVKKKGKIFKNKIFLG